MVKKAVFFDRDGVLSELVLHDGVPTAPWSINEFRFIKNAKEAVDLIKKTGYNAFVVTNQPDVNDKKLPIEDLRLMTRMLKNWLGIEEVICAFNRNEHFYKPNNGMIEFLIQKFQINRKSSWMVGDSWKDIVAGNSSRLKTIYIGTDYNPPSKYKNIQPDYMCSDVLHACKLIKEMNEND